MTIPVAALERHIGILGKTGSGKSNAAKVLAEGIMQGGGRVCVIDPTGTWWGVRLWPNGKPSRFKPVIFGGNHADIAISAEHGAAVGEAIATASSSAIIDTRLMTVGARTRFFTGFGEALLRTNKGPLHLIIDEAHLFAPQGKVNDPQSGAMLHAANNLVSLGRGIGLRIMLISQRPAKLHKDSLTQIETLVALRLIAPHDRRAIDDWIGEWADPAKGKEITASLASLPTGTAWVWSPEINLLDQIKFPLAATFDSGKPLSFGEAAPELTPIDIKEVGDRLDNIRQEAEANNPARLKAEINRLTAALNKSPKHDMPDPAAIEAAQAKAYSDGYKEGRKAGQHDAWIEGESAIRAEIGRLQQDSDSVARDAAAVHRSLKSLDQAIAKFSNRPRPDVQNPAPAATAPVRQLKRPSPIAPKTEVSGGRLILTNPQSALLATLAWWRAMGHAEPTRAQIAAKVGWKVGGSNLRNRFADLSGLGLIEYPSTGLVRLTEAGVAAAPEPDVADGLIESIRRELTNPQRSLFDVLLNAAGPMSREQIGAALGWEPGGSNLRNRLADLSARELIRYPGKGIVELQEWVQ